MTSIISVRIPVERRPLLHKHIVTWSYWLGLLSSVIALGLRSLNLLGLVKGRVIEQGRTLWYMSFYKGAFLFFLIAIATASYAWVRGEKT